MDIALLVCLSILPAIAIAAGLSDLTTMRIPNWMSLVLIVGFFPTALIVGLSPMAVGLHVLVAIVALLVGMGLFALRVIGGGDAKLMSAACLWLGLAGAGPFLVYTALIGGLFCAFLILARKSFTAESLGGPAWVGSLLAPTGDIPYGVAICAGALFAFPASPLIAAFAAG